MSIYEINENKLSVVSKENIKLIEKAVEAGLKEDRHIKDLDKINKLIEEHI